MAEEISRRNVLGLAGASALAAGLASCKAAEPYSKDALTRRTEEILDFATSDRFMDELKAVIDTPKERQLEEAARRFAPERLAELGLKLPPNTRISSRVFDGASGKSRVLGEEKTVNLSSPATAPVAINLTMPSASLSRSKVEALVDKNKVLSNRDIVAAGVCVCVGNGVCVGVGN